MTSFSQRASAAAALTLALASGGALATGSHTPYPENPTPSAPTTTPVTNTNNNANNAAANAAARAAARATAIAAQQQAQRQAQRQAQTANGGTAQATGGAAQAAVDAAQTLKNNVQTGSQSIGGSKSLALSLNGVTSDAVAVPANGTQCPEAVTKSRSFYIFSDAESHSGVDMGCQAVMNQFSMNVLEVSKFYGTLDTLLLSGKQDQAAFAMSAFRQASTPANDGAKIVVSNIVRCGEPLMNHAAFSVLATEKDLTCPTAPVAAAPAAPATAAAPVAAKAVYHAPRKAAVVDTACVNKPATALVCPGKAPSFKIN